MAKASNFIAINDKHSSLEENDIYISRSFCHLFPLAAFGRLLYQGLQSSKIKSEDLKY
jgi:hypothetical protein